MLFAYEISTENLRFPKPEAFCWRTKSSEDSRCYFLVFVQESNQRKRLGGGVEAAVYRYYLNYPTLLPRLRATLPPDPLPGLVVGLVENEIKQRLLQSTIDYRVIAKPEGLWQSPGTMLDTALHFDRWYWEIPTGQGPRNDTEIFSLAAFV